MLGPNSIGFNPNQGILFIVGGIAQVFWIIPVIRRWGMPWYFVGIGGTLIFIAIYFITRIPDNPITGRGGRISDTGVATEFFQIAFVVLLVAMIIYEIKVKRPEKTEPHRKKNKKPVLILLGVVAALVIIGLFVLPLTSEQGGSPRGPSGSGGLTQGGSPQGQMGAPQGESTPPLQNP
jgi:ABC-type xylose transport system permease subunit